MAPRRAPSVRDRINAIIRVNPHALNDADTRKQERAARRVRPQPQAAARQRKFSTSIRSSFPGSTLE